MDHHSVGLDALLSPRRSDPPLPRRSLLEAAALANDTPLPRSSLGSSQPRTSSGLAASASASQLLSSSSPSTQAHASRTASQSQSQSSSAQLLVELTLQLAGEKERRAKAERRAQQLESVLLTSIQDSWAEPDHEEGVRAASEDQQRLRKSRRQAAYLKQRHEELEDAHASVTRQLARARGDAMQLQATVDELRAELATRSRSTGGGGGSSSAVGSGNEVEGEGEGEGEGDGVGGNGSPNSKARLQFEARAAEARVAELEREIQHRDYLIDKMARKLLDWKARLSVVEIELAKFHLERVFTLRTVYTQLIVVKNPASGVIRLVQQAAGGQRTTRSLADVAEFRRYPNRPLDFSCVFRSDGSVETFRTRNAQERESVLRLLVDFARTSRE